MDYGKHAFLIMAHGNIEQLKLLIKALDNRRVDMFIHFDKKSSIRDFSELKRIPRLSYIEVFSEVEVYWADFSQVECELALLKHSTAHGDYEYYHLLSNADFITRPIDDVLSFFDDNHGKEFVSFRFPMNMWPFRNKPYTTEHKYYHILTKHLRGKNKILNKAVWCIEYLAVFFQFLFRVDRIKGEYVSCKGSNWWSITDSLARYILSKEEWIYKHFRYTRSGDEIFTSILVYNSEYNDKLYDSSYTCSNNANQRYIDWNRGFPYVFKVEDYDEIISSGFPFVRKTDMRIDGGLVQKLYDNAIKGKE